MSGINRKDKELMRSLAQYELILAEKHKTAAIFSTFISQNG
jgi:hypothetical protein